MVLRAWRLLGRGERFFSRVRVAALTASALVALVGAGPAAARHLTDTTPPTISGPSSLTASATSDCGETFCATVNLPLTASDPDDPSSSLTISCNSANGSTFSWGQTYVTCQAFDPAGNHSAPFYVTVYVTVPPPTFQNVPASITTGATGSMGAVVTFVPPTATDVGGRSAAASCDHLSGIAYPIATTVVTCTATVTRSDSNHNSFTVNTGTAQFTITVTPPTSGGGGGTGGGGNTSGGGGTGGTGGGGTGGGSASGVAIGTGGGTTTESDTTPPIIQQHANIKIDASTPSGARVAYTTTVSDPDDGTARLIVSCRPASGSSFALGAHAATRNTVVTCHARDAAANQAKAMSFSITVIGAHDQLGALERQIGGARRLLGVHEKALLASLRLADRSVRAHAKGKADSELGAFITQVSQLSRQLRRTTRAKWIGASARVIAVLG